MTKGQYFQTSTAVKNESRLILQVQKNIFFSLLLITFVNFDGPRPVKNGSSSDFLWAKINPLLWSVKFGIAKFINWQLTDAA